MKNLNGKQIRLVRVERKGYKPFLRKQEVNKEKTEKSKETPIQKVTQEVKLKRRMKLPDIPAEQANKTTDILDFYSHRRYRFKEGTKLERCHVFAGKGSRVVFRDAGKWSDKLGGKPEDWQHCAGWSKITDGKKILYREIHWIQKEEGKPLKAFIKKHKKENK